MIKFFYLDQIMKKVKVTAEYPPKEIYDKCVEQFGVSFEKGTVFAVDDKIHMYKPQQMSDHLMAHETTHIKQQSKHGWQEWWDRYLEDPEFRLLQELEAYHNQYKFLLENTNRQFRKFVLKRIVKDLSGKMYGNLISPEEAERVITKEYH